MKKLLFLLILAAMVVSCSPMNRKSPDIHLRPDYIVTSVGETAEVLFTAKSDGKKKVSVADTTIARATLIQDRIYVLGIKEGITTLDAEVGLTSGVNWGKTTCTVEVRPSAAD